MAQFQRFSRTSPYTGLIRVYGALATLFGLALCWLAFKASPSAHNISDWKHLLVPGALIVIIGIGTTFLLRAFAIILSIACAAIGAWIIAGSILHVPFPWLILNILIGLAALLPLYSLVKIWRISKEQLQI